MNTSLLRIICIILLESFVFNYSGGQTVEQIKIENDKYMWGEGTGITLKEADNEALHMLISQISVQVESKYEQFTGEVRNDNDFEFKEKIRSVVRTYSSATLHNTERIVISNEPDAKVFRYLMRSEINKVFESRKKKIFDFVVNARKAVRETRIGDGLRYYYWAFTLLKSHPECNNIQYSINGKKHLLISWIPMQINEVFANIDFIVAHKESKEQVKTIFLNITYNNEPVDNLDYSYWDGRDWSNLFNVKDGRGLLEYFGAAAEGKKEGRVKVEYIYENQANIDNELKTVLDKINPIHLPQSYYNIPFIETNITTKPVEKKIKTNITKVSEPFKYNSLLNEVQKAVKEKKYEKVRGIFTNNGYNMFKKLIKYGDAKIMSEPEFSFYRFGERVVARSLPMSFSFKNNDQQFIEDVVFHFNKNKKIESLSFGLSTDALKSIIEKDVWSENDRMILINFLEHYKTAYALKRLDYIESIFAQDALIITGYVLKIKPNADSRYQNNRIIRYNRQSKEEYIRNLRYSFSSKEYINIQFEENRVRKGGTGGNIYGVRIKQNYYSSNYGDQGYLFLMVDLNDPNEPIIHIRTWQPTIEVNDTIYGLSDF